MKIQRLFWVSSAVCVMMASCQKQQGSASGGKGGSSADDLASERADLEDARMSLERERLEEDRAALEAEKEALRAEREARLAAREGEADAQDQSLEEKQRLIDQREIALGSREGDLAARESNLSDRELELAGTGSLDDWEPEPQEEAQEPVSDYGTFYDDLQPYGSWFETPDYGYVYQPTVVVQDTSWRPYTRGSWTCTNRGWNWVSEEPFGWACFHYGRWTHIPGRGWVWVPGDEWAPSWVCWREGGEHVGWAPLPPETLCHRRHDWNSSVETDFGIGSSWFIFVNCRHMADPIWKHCLPPGRNGLVIKDTRDITNLKYHRGEMIAGGPRYDKLRNLVGKPWPVYQIQLDRLDGKRDPEKRNAFFRGNQLAVFAPNLNTRWNGGLKPSKIAGKWDDVKIDRADNAIKPEWKERFRDARQKQQEQAVAWTRENGDAAANRQKQLEANRQKVADAQAKLEVKQKEMTEDRSEKFVRLRDAARPVAAGKDANGEEKPSLADRHRQAADRLRELSAQRRGDKEGDATALREKPAVIAGRDRAEAPEVQAADRAERTPQGQAERDRLEAIRERQQQAANGGDNTPDNTRRDRVQEIARPQARPSEVQATDDAAQTARRDRLEENRRQREEQTAQRQTQGNGNGNGNADEGNRRQQMEQARRDSQEQARQQAQQDKGQAEENTRRQQQADNARERMEQNRRQQEEARTNQEQARRQAEDNGNRQQQQEEAKRQRQEQARAQQDDNARRQQQDDMKRQQQEQARQQQEDNNARQQQQEEAKRQRQEQTRAQQEENARRQQQDDMKRQAQEQARQQQQEQARQQQQEERARQQAEAQERARQQQEERQRQQEERARQQEQARQQQEEARRQQQEERARQQAEAQERARQQQEERQRQQEERQRQQEQAQQERARQQEQARQEQQEKARQQQEEQQRQRGR